MDRNVELKGFLFGENKNKVLLSSKIMVHPAIYDTGGMAVCARECHMLFQQYLLIWRD